MGFDREGFAADLAAIKREHGTSSGPEDLAHLRKMERWTRLCAVVGWSTAWLAPNPLSVLALSTSRFARWTMLSHHVMHKGYDGVPDVPERYTSGRWASGRRRLLDWFDWMHPEAWRHEHNVMHHYRLGEPADPDLVEDAIGFLRDARVPLVAKYAFTLPTALLWKPLYYTPTTFRSLHRERARRRKKPTAEGRVLPFVDWLPTSAVGRDVWLRSWLPYGLLHFVVLPALFWPLGAWAALSVLTNNLLAELLTNLHTFAVIAPNHAGDDVWRFDGPVSGKDEFLLRQVVGSVNYPCGSDGLDFAHGFLNYQIEHHLWPRASMLELRRMQPHVKALCARYGVPYVQQGVHRRVAQLVGIIVGTRTMRRLPAGADLGADLGTGAAAAERPAA